MKEKKLSFLGHLWTIILIVLSVICVLVPFGVLMGGLISMILLMDADIIKTGAEIRGWDLGLGALVTIVATWVSVPVFIPLGQWIDDQMWLFCYEKKDIDDPLPDTTP